LVAYDAEEAARIVGRPSREIESILGYPGRAEMVHRDDMALADRAVSPASLSA
jgi:glutamate 5-kinase